MKNIITHNKIWIYVFIIISIILFLCIGPQIEFNQKRNLDTYSDSLLIYDLNSYKFYGNSISTMTQSEGVNNGDIFVKNTLNNYINNIKPIRETDSYYESNIVIQRYLYHGIYNLCSVFHISNLKILYIIYRINIILLALTLTILFKWISEKTNFNITFFVSLSFLCLEMFC